MGQKDEEGKVCEGWRKERATGRKEGQIQEKANSERKEKVRKIKMR